ncbi:10199_t:CDS:2, partial [Gigaspora rosea]
KEIDPPLIRLFLSHGCKLSTFSNSELAFTNVSTKSKTQHCLVLLMWVVMVNYK